MSARIRVYAMPLCGVCQEWKAFLDAEEAEYESRPLNALAGDIPASEAWRTGLIGSMARRVVDGGALLIAPVVVVVHEGKRSDWNLISEGEPPPVAAPTLPPCKTAGAGGEFQEKEDCHGA